MKANFSQHDTNGDGWIDAEEAKSLPTPRGQGGGPGDGAWGGKKRPPSQQN
jgi:hypothetical protein